MPPNRVRAVVRVRPLLDFESGHRTSLLQVEPVDEASGKRRRGLLSLSRAAATAASTTPQEFQVDAVFPESISQPALFKGCNVGSMVAACLKGYHATVFVYGQTGSGKTFTMEGYQYEELAPSRSKRGLLEQRAMPRAVLSSKNDNDEKLGIIPRAIHTLFDLVSQKNDSAASSGSGAGTGAGGKPPAAGARRYRVRVSYLQIYNEQVYDLLNPSHIQPGGGGAGTIHGRTVQPPGLRVRWTKDDDFYVENLFVHEVSSAAETMAYLHQGIRRKVMAAHKMNAASSRSHCVLRLHVESFDVSKPMDVLSSRLTLVDLAGSERASRTGATGTTLKESIGINKSLFVLRAVIQALATASEGDGPPPHIPYRDSKLTALLRQSLGGNSLTLMIACVAASDEYVEENWSTLSYASMAQRITNKPVVNEDPRSRLIRELRAEVAALKAEVDQLRTALAEMGRGGGGGGPPASSPPKLCAQCGVDVAASRGGRATAGAPAAPRPQPASLFDQSAHVQKLRKQLDKLETKHESVEADNTHLSLENQQLREKVEILEYLLAEQDKEPPTAAPSRSAMGFRSMSRTSLGSRPTTGTSASSVDRPAPPPVDVKLLTTTGRLMSRLPSGMDAEVVPPVAPSSLSAPFFTPVDTAAPQDPMEAMAELNELMRARAGLRAETLRSHEPV